MIGVAFYWENLPCHSHGGERFLIRSCRGFSFRCWRNLVQFFLQRKALEVDITRSLALVTEALHQLRMSEKFVGGLCQVQVLVTRAGDEGSELVVHYKVGAFLARRRRR